MTMEASQGSDSPGGGRERSRRDILRSAKRTWVPLDEQLPPGLAVPGPEDPKQESIQRWLDSGFFVSVNENFQQGINHAAFAPEQGMVHVTVQDYMRSLEQFPETPTLSRGTSFNSCCSAASVPQSIPEWLEFWEKDPVEILLDLGFGTDEPDICTQIPARFLGCASAARGINIRVFLEAQKQRMDIENPNLYGRFRQLEILDHVANAFSSLLNEVNTLQSKAEERDGEESEQRTSVGGATEHQRRVGELLRKASKQNTRGDCSSQVSESLKSREEFSIPSAQPGARGAQLPVMTDSPDDSHLPPLATRWSLQACDDLTPCRPPQALLKKWWPATPMLARHAPPSCMSEGPVNDRTPKENRIQANTLRSCSSASRAPDSFEMEEVQSFEEESGDPPNLTAGTVGATVSRASSCQSDSSGFLEEPPEPPAWQMPSLPAGQSPAEDGCRDPEGQSPRLGSAERCQQGSEESSSKSGASTSFSSQDWSGSEDKSPEPEVEKESQLEAMGVQPGLLTSDVALSWATPGGDRPGKDSHQRQPPPVPQTQHEANIGRTPCRGDCPLEFLVTEGGDGFLRPEGAREAHAQRHPWESHTSPGMEGAPHRSPPAGSEALRGAGSTNTCPDLSQTRGHLPPPVPKPSVIRTSAVDLRHTSEKAIPHLNQLSGGATPQAKPRCGALGQIPPRAEPELGAPPSSADSNSTSSESVTVQMSSGLVSAAQSAVAWGTHSRRTSSECTVGDPVTLTQPVLGTEARQFNDVSVQTCVWEPRSWRCCSVPSNKAQPLTKSVSLDTGFPSSRLACICCAAPARCRGCCHHHPHCHSVGPSPGPVSSACRHGPHSHGHLEARCMKTLEVLQDTAVRELCSCTAFEMEAMKTLCQGFREHLEEMDQCLTGQQALFSRDMSEEERKEAEHLQTLRKALRQQVEELEFQLGDRARQIRGGVLLLELLSGEPPENCTNPHRYDWTEDKKGQIPPAQAHPALSPGAAFSADDDGQQASSPRVSLVAACPPLASELHPRMSPPAREGLGAALLSQHPVGEKETDVRL
ncbi:protein ITPRID1 isoform 2-T4 [Glossophaga mutica]